ncbi:unnamed protein product [Amaranthus hypochondriacus]
MLLRNSITNTKKFFQKTIENFKSFLSTGNTYQKLPKTPPFHPFSCGPNPNDQLDHNNELDNFYNEFTNQWDLSKKKMKKKAQKKNHKFFLQESINFSAITEENVKNPEKNGDFETKKSYIDAENGDILKKKRFNIINPGIIRKAELCSRSVREKRVCFVEEKIKELEKMDKGNVDYNKVDFEEFLHYYSRLTCPAYLDIVDKFLMEMYTEFFNSQMSLNV